MRQEIKLLQKEMQRQKIDMYLIPTGDEHQSEYIGEFYKFRAYLSGFTGSAGTLLVTKENSLLWTDGRYFVQGAKELENSGIILMKSGEKDVPSITEYISEHIKTGETLGADTSLLSGQFGKLLHRILENSGAFLKDCVMAVKVWSCRPEKVYGCIRPYSLEYAGCSVKEKLQKIRTAMEKQVADVHFVSSLDDLAWIFNLRGCDIPYNPVFYSYGCIFGDKAVLFVNKANKAFLEDYFAASGDSGIEIRDYDSFFSYLEKELHQRTILLDEGRCSYKTIELLKRDNKIVLGENPSVLFKSIKNETECENIRYAHFIDGLVMCRYIYWLKETVRSKTAVTEWEASKYLDQLRLKMTQCQDLSFDTIGAYGANAAMCHYSPDRDHPVLIQPEGFFLVDSGGQYFTGTTDVTRTISTGPLTDEQKKHYTLVLKGHIRLAMAHFPMGVCGENLDILARGPLWDEGLDFNHGTGHGVGCYLNVHEGPNSIRWNLNRINYKPVPLMPGMLTSNEPGLYFEGKYGIRLENLVLVDYADKENKNGFLRFETVTRVPFDRDSILPHLLSKEELDWLNEYHASVYHMYAGELTAEERMWLERETEAFSIQDVRNVHQS